MPVRLGPGPVFARDCVATSRRWQVYAGRALVVGSLLAALGLVWAGRFSGAEFASHRELAAVGERFFEAIMGVGLAMALVLVPAAAAGSLAQDRARGNLALELATGLSDAEVVLGRLAGRLVAVLGVVACSLPVLAIAASLGGVAPTALLGGALVVVGLAALGCAVALTYSLWASRPHEALMATYATWAGWLLTLLIWGEMAGRPFAAPRALYLSNPFWLIYGDRGPDGEVLARRAGFAAGCLALSALLAALATWRLRPVVLRRAGRAATVARQRGAAGRFAPGMRMPGRSLDDHPVAWREWHRRRPSAWARGLWRLHAAITAAFTVVALTSAPDVAPGVAGFSVAIGLLLVAATAATALAEERAHGSLDVLLTTPLATWAIVVGKWWGAFRPVPGLAIAPAVLTLGAAWRADSLAAATVYAALVVGMATGSGAMVASLGLFCSAWQRRPGRAVALTVGLYLLAAVVAPAVVLSSRSMEVAAGWALLLSPFFEMYLPTAEIGWGRLPIFGADQTSMLVAYAACMALTWGPALALRRATGSLADRLLGRMPERPWAPAGLPDQ